MDNSSFENKIREKIFYDTAPVDTEQLWNDINKKRKKKRPFIFFLFSGLAMLLLGIGFVFINHTLTYHDANKNVKKTSYENQNRNKILSKVNDTEVNSNTELINHKNTKTNPTIDDKKTVPIKKGIPKTNFKESHKKNTSRNSTHKSNISVFNELKGLKTELNKNQVTSNNIESETYQTDLTQSLNNSKSEESSNKKNDSSKKIISEIHQDELDIADYISSLNLNPFNVHNPLSLNYNPLDINLNKRLNKMKPKSKSLFIGINGSYDFIRRKRKTKTQDINARWSFTSERIEPVSRLGVGFDIGYQFKNQFYIKSGLSFQKMTEKVSHTWAKTEQIILEDQVIEEIVSNNGIERKRGDVVVNRTTQYVLNQYNKTSFFEVPIGLGYSTNQSKKGYFLNAELGVIFGFGTHQEGQVFLSETDLVSLNTQATLKSNFGICAYGSLGINRYLTDRMWLNISLKGSNYFSDVSTTDYPLNLKYGFLGGQVGVCYLLK